MIRATPLLLSMMPLAQDKHATNWRDDFKLFSLEHLLSVLFFVAFMLGACWLGRRWKETPREALFRKTWGWTVLGFSVWYSSWYLLPAHFTWHQSLPLQLCDLTGFIAGAAMVWHWRPLRTILYFWAIGLSTQAFVTPIINTGPASLRYWMFFVSHTMIVGSAVYDVVVCGYRPGVRDLRLAILAGVVYTASMFLLDIWMSRVLGEPINYGFVGDTPKDNATVMDKLGPWPWRVLILSGIVMVMFVLLWGVWPLARRMGLAGGEKPAASGDDSNS